MKLFNMKHKSCCRVLSFLCEICSYDRVMTKIFKAPVSSMISSRIENPILAEAITILAGSLLMALLAQISFHLPFSPVPITGQTFGVSLLALLWGRNRAVASFALYLSEGAVGLPVFAHRGYAKTFSKALACCYLGSAIVFGAGLLGLSYFVPRDSLLAMGLIPFLPGDLLKNLLAASLVSKICS